jgi:hypothetical protein
MLSLKNSCMAGRSFTIWEVILAAAKSVPGLWTDDDEINMSELARYYEKKGHPLSQPTFSRMRKGLHVPSPATVDATHYVFGVPRAILRGEPMTSEMEKVLTDYKLSTILLAQKLEGLPRADFKSICDQIERAYEQEEALRRALRHSNITPIDKDRR